MMMTECFVVACNCEQELMFLSSSTEGYLDRPHNRFGQGDLQSPDSVFKVFELQFLPICSRESNPMICSSHSLLLSNPGKILAAFVWGTARGSLGSSERCMQDSG